MIEGVFVKISPESRTMHGFHSTFYLEANNAQNAVHRVRPLIRERLQAHGVTEIESGIFNTYFWVHDIWEITGDKLSENEGRDSGFSFFRIGHIEGFYLYVRRLFFLKFRPWLMVFP